MMKLIGRDEIRNIEKLVIHAPNWLGDSVMARPLVEDVRKRCPHVSITVVTRPALVHLWDSHPEVSEVLTFDRFESRGRIKRTLSFIRTLNRRAYDAAIILPVGMEFVLLYLLAGVRFRIGYNHNRRGPLLTHALPVDPAFRARHLAGSYSEMSRVFGGKSQSCDPVQIPFHGNSNTPVGQRTRASGRQPCVLLHIWSSHGPAKRWPLARFAELGQRLTASHGVQVVLVGGKDAREAGCEVNRLMNVSSVNLCGETALSELFTLVSAASLLVSTDSGPAHVAAMLGIPVLTLFGSSSPSWTRPLGARVRVIYRALNCSPCFSSICPLGTYACFQEISVDDVWQQAVDLLEERLSTG